jgi:hypothetical protein
LSDDPNGSVKAESAPPTEGEPETPGIAAIPPEVLDRLPAPQRELIETFMAFGTFPVQNPMLRQVRPEHITTVLQYQGRATELEAADRSDSRKTIKQLTILGAILAVFLILVLSLSNHSADLSLILQYGVPFLGGVGAGYGLSDWRHRRESN